MQDDFWATGVRHAFVIFTPGTITMCCTSAIYLAPNFFFITRLSDIPYHILCLLPFAFCLFLKTTKFYKGLALSQSLDEWGHPSSHQPLTSKTLISSSSWSSPDPLKNSPNSVSCHPSALFGYLRPSCSPFSLGCGCGAWNPIMLLRQLLKNPTRIGNI